MYIFGNMMVVTVARVFFIFWKYSRRHLYVVIIIH